MPLARLCYTSQATKPDHLVRQDLMDIITEAVSFNAQHKIFGVLYYGNGYFFQCLEGDKNDLEQLYYGKITKDPRHQNATLMTIDPITELQFSAWNMKFAPYHQSVMEFMRQQDRTQFDPNVLSTENLPAFLEILYQI